MNQLLKAKNRPGKGALYWDNLSVYIATMKIYLLTRIWDGQKRKKKKKNLKNICQLMRNLKHSPDFLKKKKKKRKEIHIFK